MAKHVFRTAWNNPFKPVGIDCSNTKEKLYEEILPYTKDENGKLINDSPYSIFVEKGYVDIQEKIQSYAKECDIYSILEKFANSGDESFIQKSVGYYGDISSVPTNLNDFNDLVNNGIDNIMAMPEEIGKAILNDSLSTDEVVDTINNFGKQEEKKEGEL